jgi:lantibiotic modifying enzyme
MTPISRRTAIRIGLCAGASIPALPRLLLADWTVAFERGLLERPYLDAALRAERWIRSVAMDTAAGRTWPMAPGDARSGKPQSGLYSGAPGVVLFYLELHRHTGEKAFLDEAVKGALEMISSFPESGSPARSSGLYTGLGGDVFVVSQVQRASGRDDLRAAAVRGARAIAAAAQRDDKGTVGWTQVTDIVSGNAGTGLALLSFRDQLGDEAIDLARRAGDRLLESGLPVADGQRRWLMTPDNTRELPNFSHGTGGVAYFLATLSQSGGERKHLDGALDGARYLKSLMVPSGDGTVIRHNSTETGKDLFYLSWCHGPPGTNRLWERLHRIDGKGGWRNLEDSGARGIVGQGVPEKRTAGFWNNISLCCGNAGVAEYFLARHGRNKESSDLAYAKRHADDLLAKGTVEGDRQKWIQAENRVSPDDVKAQTGWMQGAAGVGAMLLHLDAATQGKRKLETMFMPDSPWAS